MAEEKKTDLIEIDFGELGSAKVETLPEFNEVQAGTYSNREFS